MLPMDHTLPIQSNKHDSKYSRKNIARNKLTFIWLKRNKLRTFFFSFLFNVQRDETLQLPLTVRPTMLGHTATISGKAAGREPKERRSDLYTLTSRIRWKQKKKKQGTTKPRDFIMINSMIFLMMLLEKISFCDNIFIFFEIMPIFLRWRYLK